MKIKRPTLLVDEEIVRNNIRKMALKANRSEVQFRPHFKTHQSADIGEWFRDQKLTQITVSSVSMAQYFAQAGWDDITIAFPYNPLEADELNSLAKSCRISVLIESEASLNHLEKYVKVPINYLVKIDVGTMRTGIVPHEPELIAKLCHSKKHAFKGLLSHAGHSYRRLDIKQAQAIFERSIKTLKQAQGHVSADPFFSYGDTPTCSLLDNFSAVNEIRPGNFAFYDCMQADFGSCLLKDIAVCLACPIVAIHSARNEAVIYGGAVHLSKESMIDNDLTSYGQVVRLSENGWDTEPVGHLSGLSQEHGIIRASSKTINAWKVGDLIGVLPVHSCLTANLQPFYLNTNGFKIKNINTK